MDVVANYAGRVFVRKRRKCLMYIYNMCVILCMLSVPLLQRNSRSGKTQPIFIFHRKGIEQKTAISWLVDLSVISLLSSLSLFFYDRGKTIDITVPKGKNSPVSTTLALFVCASSCSICTRLLQTIRRRQYNYCNCPSPQNRA